ncbi:MULTISPECIES: CoA pyrophosphatase [Rhodomicrobium]|uniref:CoA pyrophosphatase n=1 Tax=Rhodomicrobium TaxID=1068 RepID=UPI001FD88FBD|nr:MULTISPECIES: CoA pyrophosphatase [Rhodomicrobium]
MSMRIESGAFTADDFQRRAKAYARPVEEADSVARSEALGRGDYDLNPDLLGAPPPPGGYRAASVLIGIVDREPGATVVLTLRAEHLPTHAGQIAFPGGRVDPGDATVIDTALREAHEEIGLDRRFVTPLGLLDGYRTRTGFNIVPVLAVIAPAFSVAADEREVAEVFEVPLAFLMSVANHQRHSREWQGQLRHFYAMPYGERYIWGATAGILRMMYERLYAE